MLAAPSGCFRILKPSLRHGGFPFNGGSLFYFIFCFNVKILNSIGNECFVALLVSEHSEMHHCYFRHF